MSINNSRGRRRAKGVFGRIKWAARVVRRDSRLLPNRLCMKGNAAEVFERLFCRDGVAGKAVLEAGGVPLNNPNCEGAPSFAFF